jgi:hypothetical protein
MLSTLYRFSNGSNNLVNTGRERLDSISNYLVQVMGERIQISFLRTKLKKHCESIKFAPHLLRQLM